MVASRLRALRKDRGLTQAALAKQAGVCRSVIARHEAGVTTMSMKNLLKVSKILGTSLDDIAGGEQRDGQAS